MVRTIEEIKERIKKESKEDELGLWWEFRGKILASFLPKKDLEELGFKVKDTWKPDPLTEEEILKQMKDYFDFAVGKCIDQRGISANRSVAHYEEWIWLLGDDEFLKEIKNTEYTPYGKPILLKIAKKYGFDKEFPEEYEELKNFEWNGD